MYSIVLLAALTTGDATPNWCFHSCCGCCGCCGYGCYHGYCGCYGGCYGYCGGSCGCCGCGYGCGGCCGCYGGYGGAGGWGAYNMGGYSGWGCWACVGAPGTQYGPVPSGGPAGPGMYNPESLPTPNTEKTKPKTESSVAPNRARLIVEAPQDAKLFVNDKPIPFTSEKRSFSTPELKAGESYYYEVRVEIMRDGKPVSETRKVVIQRGDVARVDFKNMNGTRTAAVMAR